MTVAGAEPREWFTVEFLELADPRYVRWNGETVTITADNGRWIWRVESIDHATRVVHGVWPD